jgi:hypothetical protein
MRQGYPSWAKPSLTRTKQGQLCIAPWTSWSRPAATEPERKPRVSGGTALDHPEGPLLMYFFARFCLFFFLKKVFNHRHIIPSTAIRNNYPTLGKWEVRFMFHQTTLHPSPRTPLQPSSAHYPSVVDTKKQTKTKKQKTSQILICNDTASMGR